MAWQRVGEASAIKPGEVRGLEFGSSLIAVYRLGDAFYATDNLCTHEFSLLSDGYVEGDKVECALHQAIFHIPTGQVIDGPTDKSLKTYPTKVENGVVFVDV